MLIVTKALYNWPQKHINQSTNSILYNVYKLTLDDKYAHISSAMAGTFPSGINIVALKNKSDNRYALKFYI
jgi:hypothetical protein